MKRFRIAMGIILTISLITTLFCGCEKENEGFKDKVEVNGYGLHVSESGWITLNGKPFYGFGMVWKDGFKMKLNDPSADIDKYFAKLAEGGIPYVRVMLGFDDAETVNKYLNSKDEFYAAMDSFVQTAEKYKIGIVANLFWNPEPVALAFGENLKKMITEPDCQSYKFAEEYSKEIAARYKDSKALWAWEISNEGNLMCEVKKVEIQYTDGSTYLSNFTTEMLKKFYIFVSDAIRSVDSYRMIINGDASPRFFAKALRTNFETAPWDTDEDMEETFSLYSQGSVDCLSVHTPYISFLERYQKCAKNLKKGIYVGAFCGTPYEEKSGSKQVVNETFAANEIESFNAYVDAYLKYGIQMATAMNFASYATNPGDLSSVEVGTTEGVESHKFVWDRLAEENAKLVSEGMNSSAEYWN